jgi:hypothetical protein
MVSVSLNVPWAPSIGASEAMQLARASRAVSQETLRFGLSQRASGYERKPLDSTPLLPQRCGGTRTATNGELPRTQSDLFTTWFARDCVVDVNWWCRSNNRYRSLLASRHVAHLTLVQSHCLPEGTAHLGFGTFPSFRRVPYTPRAQTISLAP